MKKIFYIIVLSLLFCGCFEFDNPRKEDEGLGNPHEHTKSDKRLKILFHKP